MKRYVGVVRRAFVLVLCSVLAFPAPLVRAALTPAPDPDINNDGKVSILDVAIVGSCFGQDPATASKCRCADTNADGRINQTDLNFVRRSFGRTGFPVGPNPCVANQPPRITSTPPTRADKDAIYIYQLQASDPESDAVTFAFQQSPSGMSINATTGVVSWFPTGVGSQVVTVEARDARGAATTQTYTLVVAAPNLNPVITSVPPRFAKLGERYTYDVEAFDHEGEATTFEFAAAPPAGMTINPQTGLVVWPAAGPAGSRSVSIRARDTGDGIDVQTYELNIVDVSLALLSPQGAFEVAVGNELVLPIEANYAKAGFSVAPMPDNATLDGGSFHFTPSAAQEGLHALSFQAEFADMRVANVVTIAVSRTNAAPVLVPIPAQGVGEGQELSFRVEATDPDGDALRFSAPGLSLANAFFNELTQQFLFRPSFDQAGRHDVVFQVSDGRGSAQQTVPINVADVQPPAEPLNLIVDQPNNPTFATRQNITGSVVGQAGPPPAPALPVFITGLSPTSVRQGRSVDVQITGLGTNFVAGSTSADFGSDITVDSIEVQSPTSARATIQASRDAELGARQVRLSQGGSEVYSVVAFSVEQGVASVVGRVIDPFTGGPLAGARVGVNGSNAFVLADADGRFSLEGVPPGVQTLVATLPNRGVQKVNVVVGSNQQLTLDQDIGLTALVRPPNSGGTLPRAATVASVVDRGVSNKGGGFTFDQAKAVVQDTLIAVGGIEAGVIDDAGSQLNPKITGAGEFSLTQAGVARHAEGLMLGDVTTVRNLVEILRGAFTFPMGLEIGDVVEGFQTAVNEAWANPSDPGSAMAILLFNEGTTLSPARPTITPDTRFNRFQVFLLFSSFLVFNEDTLGPAADRILALHGVDANSQLPPAPFPNLASVPAENRVAGVPRWQRILFGLGEMIESEAYALPPPPGNNCGDPSIPCSPADFLAKKTFSKVWRTIGANAIAEAAMGALVSASIAVAQQVFMAYTIGVTGGRLGAAFAVLITAGASMMGFTSVLFFKLVIGWYIAFVAASFEPAPPQGRPTFVDDQNNFVIPFDRSQAEIDSLSQPKKELKRSYAYHLYRFPNCAVPADQGSAEFISLEAVNDDTNLGNQRDPKTGPKQFIVPRSMLKAGGNHFRIRVFQYIHNSDTELVEGIERFDTDENGNLSLNEFQRAGLGDEFGFAAADVSKDGTLDASEYQRESGPRDIEVSPGIPRGILRSSLGHPYRSAADYRAGVALQKSDVQGQLPDAPSNVRENVVIIQKEFGKLTLPQIELLSQNIPAFKLAEESVNVAIARGPDTAQLTKAAADAQIKLQAPEVAEQLYQKHFNASPTADQVKLVENVLSIYRDIHVANESIKTLAPRYGAIEKAVVAVKTGAASEVDVELPIFKSDSLQLDPNRTQTLKVTPQNVADVELDFKTPGLESLLQGKSSAVIDFKVHAEGVVGSASQTKGSLVIRGRHNAAGVVDAIYKDSFRMSSGLPPADVEARFNEFNAALDTVGDRGIAATRIGVDQETRLKDLMSNLRGSRRQVGELPSSRLGPNIARPAGLSPNFEKGIGRGGDAAGGVVSGSMTLLTFLQSVQVLSSEFSDACFTTQGSTVPVPAEQFPPSFEPHPSGTEVSAIVRELKTGPKTGFLEREYPGDDAEVSAAEAGFPPSFVSIDTQGRIYAENTASNQKFGGRISRYTPDALTAGSTVGEQLPFTLSREFVGSTTYFNLNIQLARPATPVAMTVGPTFTDISEGGDHVATQDVFLAQIDIIDGKHQILQVPIHLIDTKPSVYGPTSAFRNQLVGQPILESDDLRLTGPSDMEVGPDVGFSVPQSNPDSIIVLSDEDAIFAIVKPIGTSTYALRKIIQVPGRRWSGLAFDKLGNFYFADYARGDIYVMPFTTFRVGVLGGMVNESPFATSDDEIAAKAFPIARGIDRPGDIELEAISSHPGGVLHVSTFNGILPITMPIIGRLDGAREVRISLFGIEQPAQLDADHNFFIVTPSREDATTMSATVRVKRVGTDGSESWRERIVQLAEHGATIIEDSL